MSQALALGRAETAANQRARLRQLFGTGSFAHLANSTIT
jgi:hypothetical protein